jgi:hypothetical protein
VVKGLFRAKHVVVTGSLFSEMALMIVKLAVIAVENARWIALLAVAWLILR